MDQSLRTFFAEFGTSGILLLLLLIVVSTLGVNVTSLIAVASAATLAIGMALSGTAQNFAGGVMILLMKPYRVGDYISAQGQSGTVREISLLDGDHDDGQPDHLYPRTTRSRRRSSTTIRLRNFGVWTGRSGSPTATTWIRRGRRFWGY